MVLRHQCVPRSSTLCSPSKNGVRVTTRRTVQPSLIALALSLGIVVPLGSAPASDCPPVSHDRYRTLPEESDVAFTALAYHLEQHPPEAGPLCVTMPGYEALPGHLARRLATPYLQLDPDPNCRFQGGRLVLGAEGVWHLQDGHYVADVRILEFHDITILLAEYRYIVTRASEAFSVQSEIVCQ
jgi:hypothetical protein